jgi:hypothetical protein
MKLDWPSTESGQRPPMSKVVSQKISVLSPMMMPGVSTGETSTP